MGHGLQRSIGSCIILNLSNLLLVDSELKHIFFLLRVLFRTVPLTIKPIKMIQKFCSSVRLHILSFANPISFKSHADKRHLRLHGSSYTAPIMLAKKDMRGNGKTAEFCPYYPPQT